MIFHTANKKILTVLCLISINFVLVSSITDNFGRKEKSPDKEFQDFCNLQTSLEANPNNVALNCKNTDEFDEEGLRMLFSIFVIILYGVFVRTMLKAFKISFPYTVVLMISGLIIGALSKYFCKELQSYTAIARVSPKILLFTFLPVLIFESAFLIPVHTFMRSAHQILILALPGMLIATFLTALICLEFFSKYEWSFAEACLFGSIISATDPVAVVSILRELGTSEMLSVLIEGESLLNDGVAILLYEIFEGIVVEAAEAKEEPNPEPLSLRIFKQFLRITLGGPAFGYIMGKIAVFCLSLIFYDILVEITITLVAAYLTYYIGEDILGVSGVMAIVALGLKMSSERTCITPDQLHSVHQFWAMLGFLANTILFVIVGIVITETALTTIDSKDIYYLLFLYVALNFIRLVMLAILYPIVKRLGYGLSWQNLIVVMWGGLRGAVGICLALEMYQHHELCDKMFIGPKFLFLTAGIVFFTLVINGTTTKALLTLLKLTVVSVGRLQDMANAVKQISSAQNRTIAMLKNDRFLADSNWGVVEKYTKITDPYKKVIDLRASADFASIISVKKDEDDHMTKCPDCHNMVKNEPTQQEYEEITEEARIRIIKALKVSYWKQFEKGMLTELAVQILIRVADTCEDKRFYIVHNHDLMRFWKIHGFYSCLKRSLPNCCTFQNEYPPEPKEKFKRYFWRIATKDWFDYLILALTLLNMIPVIWEFVYELKGINSDEYALAFFIINLIFTVIYTIELIIKIIGLGAKGYLSIKWNYIDIFVLLVSYVDIIVTLATDTTSSDYLRFIKIMRFMRIIRVLRLFKLFIPKVMKSIDRKLDHQLFLGYDIGWGFVTALDDVLKFLPQIIEHRHVYFKMKRALEIERLETIKSIGMLQNDHPGIAIAVKTRHASRAVLNYMKDSINEMKEDGLLDDKESILLLSLLEGKMKTLWKSPSSTIILSPEALLPNISWVMGNEEILEFVKENAMLLDFGLGDTICSYDDTPVGIFIIVSGMVKVEYNPNEKYISAAKVRGILPNTELMMDLSFENHEQDFFSTGTIIGELGVLTGNIRSAKVTCETPTMAFHIALDKMQEAIGKFKRSYDSLESRMWRAVGLRVGLSLLKKEPKYQSWTLDKIRVHLEHSAVPIGESYLNMKIPEFLSEVLLINGQIRDSATREIFTAPAVITHRVYKLSHQEIKTGVPTRIMVVANEDIELETASPSEIDIHEYIIQSTRSRRADSSQKVNVGVKHFRKSTVINLLYKQQNSTYVRNRKSGMMENESIEESTSEEEDGGDDDSQIDPKDADEIAKLKIN